MTKELLQQALDALIESRDDVVTGLADRQRLAGIPRYDKQITFYEAQLVKHDAAIEGLKQTLAQQEQPSKTERQIRRMFCVTYASDSSPYMDDGEAQDNSRHPCIDFLRDSPEQIQSKMVERAIAKHKAQQEQPASVDAYVGAREDAAIWKKRALEAEELNRKFIAEVNGPTYLGEPAQPAQDHYPLPDSLYPGSKDWQAGSYKERVEWLHLMYESAKQEVARLEAQQEQPSTWTEKHALSLLNQMGDPPFTQEDVDITLQALRNLNAPSTQPALSEARWNYVNSRAVDMSAAKYEALCSLLHAEVDATYDLGEAVDKAIEAHCRGGAVK